MTNTNLTKKYAMMRSDKGDIGDTEIKIANTFEEAEKLAEMEWNHLTKSEREKVNVEVITLEIDESKIDPDSFEDGIDYDSFDILVNMEHQEEYDKIKDEIEEDNTLVILDEVGKINIDEIESDLDMFMEVLEKEFNISTRIKTLVGGQYLVRE